MDPKKGWERGSEETAKRDRDRLNQISFFTSLLLPPASSSWESWEEGGRREDINVSAKMLTFREEEEEGGFLCLS